MILMNCKTMKSLVWIVNCLLFASLVLTFGCSKVKCTSERSKNAVIQLSYSDLFEALATKMGRASSDAVLRGKMTFDGLGRLSDDFAKISNWKLEDVTTINSSSKSCECDATLVIKQFSQPIHYRIYLTDDGSDRIQVGLR